MKRSRIGALLGKAVREERREQGLSQARFAKLCEVDQGWLSVLERGWVSPRLEPSLLVLRRFKSKERQAVTLMELLHHPPGKMGAKTSSLDLLEFVLRIQPEEHRASFLHRLADWLVNRGKHRLALRYYDRALQITERQALNGAPGRELADSRARLAETLIKELEAQNLRWLSLAVRARLAVRTEVPPLSKSPTR